MAFPSFFNRARGETEFFLLSLAPQLFLCSAGRPFLRPGLALAAAPSVTEGKPLAAAGGPRGWRAAAGPSQAGLAGASTVLFWYQT